MLVTAKHKRSLMSTFTMVHNYRFTNRVNYLTIIDNFTNIWYDDYTIYDTNLSITYITKIHRLNDV